MRIAKLASNLSDRNYGLLTSKLKGMDVPSDLWMRILSNCSPEELLGSVYNCCQLFRTFALDRSVWTQKPIPRCKVICLTNIPVVDYHIIQNRSRSGLCSRCKGKKLDGSPMCLQCTIGCYKDEEITKALRIPKKMIWSTLPASAIVVVPGRVRFRGYFMVEDIVTYLHQIKQVLPKLQNFRAKARTEEMAKRKLLHMRCKELAEKSPEVRLRELRGFDVPNFLIQRNLHNPECPCVEDLIAGTVINRFFFNLANPNFDRTYRTRVKNLYLTMVGTGGEPMQAMRACMNFLMIRLPQIPAPLL